MSISSAQSLTALCAALNENNDLFADGIISWTEYQFDTAELPTFGKCPLESTHQIYSWCESTDSVLVTDPNNTFLVVPASVYRYPDYCLRLK